MGCSICGRGSCTSSFHSIKEQEQHEKYAVMPESELITECIDLANEISDYESRAKELEAKIEELEMAVINKEEVIEDKENQKAESKLLRLQGSVG